MKLNVRGRATFLNKKSFFQCEFGFIIRKYIVVTLLLIQGKKITFQGKSSSVSVYDNVLEKLRWYYQVVSYVVTRYFMTNFNIDLFRPIRFWYLHNFSLEPARKFAALE